MQDANAGGNNSGFVGGASGQRVFVDFYAEAGAFGYRRGTACDFNALFDNIFTVLVVQVGGMSHVGNHGAHMQSHGFGEGTACELDDRGNIGQGSSKSTHEGRANAAFADHVGIGATANNLLTAAELRNMHEQRQTGFLPQKAPAFDIG